MARLLIAGYGFLGESLETKFLSAGWDVDKLCRSGKANCMACDLSSAEDVANLSGQYDLVIHCAASGGGGEESYKKVYLAGAHNLSARFPEARIIFTSSTSVYAQTDHAEVDEQSLAHPTTATAIILRQAEQIILDAGGLVARLSGLYGPGRCHVLKNLLNGTARLDGKGERIMNFIHRDDVAEAMLLLGSTSSAHGVYNVTSEPVSQYDCYASLAAHFGLPVPPTATADQPRKRGDSSKRVSNDKIKSMGWSPVYPDFLSLALNCRKSVTIS